LDDEVPPLAGLRRRLAMTVLDKGTARCAPTFFPTTKGWDLSSGFLALIYSQNSLKLFEIHFLV
jgi:hypothetical protein